MDDALAAIGIDKTQAYRTYGARGMKAGRPKKPRVATAIDKAENPFEAPKMKVYFIQPNGEPVVKIGVSAVVGGRLSALSTSHYKDLVLLATMDGGVGDERELHKRFAKLRVRGEWFKLEGELKKFVEKLSKVK